MTRYLPPMLSKLLTDKLRTVRTPFYLYDLGLLRETLAYAVNCSFAYGYKIHYALKANFDPRIVDEIKKYGLGVDCVSGNEVRYAIEAGFPARSIVYAGVGKSDEEMLYSLRSGIFAFNCESIQELVVMNSIAEAENLTADVALRINPDVDPLTHRHISTGQADSKFGISYKEIDELCAQLDGLKNIRITGLHFHIGSQIKEMKVFEYLCLRVNTLYKWFRERGFSFSHINVGGGLGVEYAHPETRLIPDFDTYFSTFHKNLDIDPPVEIHFELGRSLVAQCGELIGRILFIKTTAAGKTVAITDASMTDLIRPALYQAPHAIENLDGSGPLQTYTIGGTVCESTDIFARDIELAELKRGDLITLKTAGAYGACMATRYNLHNIAGAVYSDDII